MTRETLELIAPDRKKHAAEMYDLIGKVFSTGGGGYYDFRDLCRTNYIEPSHYDWAASRIGLLGGRIVTHYGIWGYDMRIGSSTVRCGGIGAVATDADYRRRGLMAQTVVASIDAMRACGYDLSILFGIPDFYDKFGYVRAWSRASDAIGIDRMTKDRPRHRVVRTRDLTRGDIAAIYAREHAGLTGTAVRPTYRAVGGAYKRWAGWRWVDKRGRTLGYVTGRPNDGAMECYEAGGDPDEAMRVLAMLARRHVCREVKFVDVHEETPILKQVRRGDCTTTVNNRRTGGPMIRTINLASSLARMRGELSRRLKRSDLATWRGALLVDDAREKVMLKIADGKVAVAARPSRTRHVIRGGDAVAQLLIGTNEPAETVEAARMRLTGDATRLVAVLFPSEHPRLCPWDGY